MSDMNRREILTYWVLAMCLGTFLLVFQPLGLLINTIASIACLAVMRPFRTPFGKEFLLLSIGGTLVLLALFQSLGVFFTMIFFWFAVLLPVMVIGVAVFDHFRAGPVSRVLSYFALTAIALVLLLPRVSYTELESPPMELTADSLAEKNPAFVDTPASWEKVESRQALEINKSAAIIALDIATIEEHEAAIQEERFATYREALDYLDAHDLPWIPSVQMVDQKVKVFSDAAYAAIELHTQHEAERLGGGRQVFLENLLEALLANKATEAAAFVATALKLSGKEPALPSEVAAMATEMHERFLKDEYASKPVGFYGESEALSRVFRQNRFCQYDLAREFDPATAALIGSGIARALAESDALATSYRAILALQARTTNPPDDGFFNLDDYRPERLQPASNAYVALFPPSGAVENVLYGQLGALPALQNQNIMNILIQAIREGTIELTPDETSGWYDYQIYALETLLVPEKGQEDEKLLLSGAYKERLLEAFRTILTKYRELHVGQLDAVGSAATPLQEVEIAPRLAVEPTATQYLRSARGLRFLETSVTAILGEPGYASIMLSDDESLAAALPPMAHLLYGLYFQVCDDIGMTPELLADELTPEEATDARTQADTWLKSCKLDSVFAGDTRYIVPVISDPAHTEVRYWMTTGVRLTKISAEYAREPRLRMDGEVLGKDNHPSSHGVTFVPSEFYIPLEEFAEATGPNVPYTREEFRALCDDRAGSREAIMAAVQSGRNETTAPWTAAAVLVGLLGLAMYGVRRRSSKAP